VLNEHPSPLPPLLQDVRVTIDGLWHEEASDLRISLVHGAQEVFLVDRGAGVCARVVVVVVDLWLRCGVCLQLWLRLC
jgi:hypothetical protein